jgi:hypothetical protein
MIDMKIREKSCFDKPFKVRRNEARKQNGGLSKLLAADIYSSLAAQMSPAHVTALSQCDSWILT